MMGCRNLALALLLCCAACGAKAAGGGSASGEARVNGKAMTLAHAYLFHAPDNWRENETNSVVMITARPLDEAKLGAATTLLEALRLADEYVQVEVRPAGDQADLIICHPEFGVGRCFSTTISQPEWTPAEAAEGHFAGSVRTFSGGEREVFQGEFRLFYDLQFDAAPVRDFDRRK